MKQLTAEQIQKNWEQLRNLISNTFEGERLDKLNTMYDYFEDRMCMAPASGREQFHYAHIGGYVEHVLHVIDCALKVMNLWAAEGARVNFTTEEVIFAAMHHDLGKVGDMDKDYYVPQESEWHRKNRGEIFTHNGALQYMSVTDRAVFLLNQFQIPMTENEYIGLRLADGLYEEANKSYYMSYNPDWALKSNIAYVIHQADMMATKIEYDEWKRSIEVEEEEHKQKYQKMVGVLKTDDKQVEKKEDKLGSKSKDLFKELFGDDV